MDLPYGIKLYTENGFSITSDLKVLPMEEEDVAWNFAIDAIESLILHHASLGVEIDDKYKQGISDCLDSLSNNV
jgi:hypothetical protein